MSEKPSKSASVPGKWNWETIWKLLWRLDVLYFLVVLVSAVIVGLFAVGRWLVRLWDKGAWWNFGLLALVTIVLCVGVIREVTDRKLGPFTVLVGALALIIGVGYLWDDGGFFGRIP